MTEEDRQKAIEDATQHIKANREVYEGLARWRPKMERIQHIPGVPEPVVPAPASMEPVLKKAYRHYWISPYCSEVADQWDKEIYINAYNGRLDHLFEEVRREIEEQGH